MPYPARRVALLDGLSDVAGVGIDAERRPRSDAGRHRARLDELVAGNREHVAMVRQLEAAYDAEAAEASATGLARPRDCPPATSWPPSSSASCATRDLTVVGVRRPAAAHYRRRP